MIRLIAIISLWFPSHLYAATLSYVMNGWDNILLVEGEIINGDAQRLDAYIIEQKGDFEPDFRIALNSNGGNLIEGIKMGLVIRKHNLSTSIGAIDRSSNVEKSRVNPSWYFGAVTETNESICASACAYAFLGGSNRYITTDNKIGFHQFYSAKNSTDDFMENAFDSALSNAQEIMGLLVIYLSSLGDVDFDILVEAVSAKPDEMNWLSINEAKRLGVISFDNYDDFYLEPYKDGVVAVSRVRDSKSGYETLLEDRIAQATFFCRNNDFILMLSSDLVDGEFNENNLIARWRLEYVNGRSEEIVTGVGIRFFNGRIYFDINANKIRKKILDSKSFWVWLDASRSAGHFAFEKSLSAFEINLIEGSQKLCIG